MSELSPLKTLDQIREGRAAIADATMRRYSDDPRTQAEITLARVTDIADELSVAIDAYNKARAGEQS